MRSIYTDPGLTIRKAASRARGDRIARLFELCESQKSVSTNRLRKIVEELYESDKLDALHFRALADFILSQPIQDKTK